MKIFFKDFKKSFVKGFTVVELLIVISIIALLTSIALVSFTKASASARDGKRKADLEQLRSALVLYRTDSGTYPGSITWTTMAPIQSYISVSSMADPKGGTYTYTTAGGGSTFSACAQLETVQPPTYCVTNP